MFIEAIETVKCLDEGVIESVADANIGSIMGIGFPGWTGGVLQYINGYEGGLPGFVARARELAETYGERFTPPDSLVARAERGEAYFDGEVLADRVGRSADGLRHVPRVRAVCSKVACDARGVGDQWPASASARHSQASLELGAAYARDPRARSRRGVVIRAGGDVDRRCSTLVSRHAARGSIAKPLLDPRDVTTCRGIPVTTVARMLVDLSDR